MIRVTRNGALDTSFAADRNDGGFWTMLVTDSATTGLASGARRVLVTPKGDAIYVIVDSGDQFSLSRLDAQGRTDNGFGFLGTQFVTRSTNAGSAWDALIQPDGRLLISSVVSTPINPTGGISVMRLLGNGQLDVSFGSGGVVILAADGGTSRYTVSASLALQPDGRILVGSRDINGYALTRLLPDGRLDPELGWTVTSTLGGTVTYSEASRVAVVLDSNVGLTPLPRTV